MPFARMVILKVSSVSYLGSTVGSFRGAFWGSSILIPLDIPPTLYANYKWIDPGLGTIPKNHWLVDMFDYDLPRTYLAHEALRAGEFQRLS